MTNKSSVTTRSELVRVLGYRAHEQYELYKSLKVVCDDMLRCVEDWLHTDWDTLATYYHCGKSRDDIINELMVLAQDQNTNSIYKIIGRQPWSQDGFECAADAMVGLIEAKLRPWEELYRTFNPEPRVVYDGKIGENRGISGKIGESHGNER